MKKSIIIFLIITLCSISMVVYGWNFVDSSVGEATLTEETLSGDKSAADGLSVGFRADSADSLHWINSFDYSANESESKFKRGDLAVRKDSFVYDDIRFTGWNVTPFFTLLDYDKLEGLQNQDIQRFYEGIQQEVMKSGKAESGRIKLADYMNYYPISFRFDFGSKVYSSNNALTGLKIYDKNKELSGENAAAYEDDVNLYVAFNEQFRIPVIDKEYQKYRFSKLKKHNLRTALGYKTQIDKPSAAGEDFYEFDPIIVIQEENIKDGKRWLHPDLTSKAANKATDSDKSEAEALEDEELDDVEGTYGMTSADEYGLKNRMLFLVNNRTAKGKAIDVSQIEGGYGVYELPIEVTAEGSVTNRPRGGMMPAPKFVIDEMQMVYPLDAEAEYVEMSLSADHRYLAVFFVKNGAYFVDLVDADKWVSRGAIKLFTASKNMSYAWGENNSLAATNHDGHIALLYQTKSEKKPYMLLYSGKPADGLDNALFDSNMIAKKHSYSAYRYGIERGLAFDVKDGKAALVQNLLIGDSKLGIRAAALECAVIDESGLLYRGRLKSDITDLGYGINANEAELLREMLGDNDKSAASSATLKQLIKPVRNENWVKIK